ncbi:MAG: sn-glycerol-3-phosphate ABC transporter ATP-binding protein UgpC [Paracoccaceae bacterium]|nr:sn-glycerol-3-phosphate ABC transporter ATP-binding protein UgpC [Paracoccaceae bacterium]MDE2911402.1 sn-glycerol-3-phosphate ABC transporter ATP-binding protein UgpC [Paracoccaceae bacterium]
MASVEFLRVAKSFGAVTAVADINFEIKDGEFAVLVGPSGCGKSTLLRILAGLETATTGSIKVGDRVVDDLQPKDRDVAMVFQNYALYPQKTVAANMGFPLRMRGVGRMETEKRVLETARTLGLEDLLKRYPKQLSGGQRQRVAMGRAIIRNPSVFLFDEPLSNLDAKLRVRMRAEIKELQQRLKTTTVYVTHDQIEAITMSDKIVVMRNGRVEQVGSPLDVFDRPANRFVAGFIGSPAMNFLEGQIVSSGNGQEFVTASGLACQLPDMWSQPVNQCASIGIRPEHIDLAEEGTPGAFSLRISVVEPTGADTMIIARSGTDELSAMIKGRHRLVPGDSICLKPMPGMLHFFASDGTAIRV